MVENSPLIYAGIVDFNPKRMKPEEAVGQGIPVELLNFIGDYRQYPVNIAQNFPDGVSWFNPDQEWFFRSVMTDTDKVARLENSDVLILSGSGLSAFKFQEHDPSISTADKEALEKAQEVIKSHIVEGKWVLGICFGGQLAVHAVGGTIGRLPNNEFGNAVTEAGWLEHTLTETGRNDEVFGYLPDVFYAPHLHSDYIASLPPIGYEVKSDKGITKVTRAEVLAFRNGYLDKNGLQNSERKYIQATLIEFDTGARLYQIQPHPEMAYSQSKANFLTRQNTWIADDKEMGSEYYQNCLVVPDQADLRIREVITKFIDQAKQDLETRQKITRRSHSEMPDLSKYLLK